MAVPKRKVSSHRRGNRRSHDSLGVDSYVEDSNSGEPKLEHFSAESLLPGSTVEPFYQNSPSPTTANHNEVNPNTPGNVMSSSLLNAGHHIGVNTQGCSMRNANRGLRSEPPNPQTQVSPWLQTTICPDLHRKSLE